MFVGLLVTAGTYANFTNSLVITNGNYTTMTYCLTIEYDNSIVDDTNNITGTLFQ